MYVCMYVCVYVCIMCIYIYIYIHYFTAQSYTLFLSQACCIELTEMSLDIVRKFLTNPNTSSE